MADIIGLPYDPELDTERNRIPPTGGTDPVANPWPAMNNITVADLVGPNAANRQSIELEKRTETIKSYINQIFIIFEQLLGEEGTPATQIHWARDNSNSPTVNMSMDNHKLTDLSTPTAGSDAVTKDYADSLSGGVSSGSIARNNSRPPTQNLSIANNKLIDVSTPTQGTDAANKAYVDTADSSLEAGTIARNNSRPPIADISFGGNKILSVAAGTQNTDGINKGQLDAAVLSASAGIDTSIARDGSRPPSATTSWNAQKISNLLAGVAGTDAANMDNIQSAIANLVDSSPGALNTLNELAAAMGDDPNFAATITDLIGVTQTALTNHIGNTLNPHAVTKAQVGLASVPNTDFTASVASNATAAGAAQTSATAANTAATAANTAATAANTAATAAQTTADAAQTTADAATTAATAAQTSIDTHAGIVDIHRKITISAAPPSGGADGDIWIQV